MAKFDQNLGHVIFQIALGSRNTYLRRVWAGNWLTNEEAEKLIKTPIHRWQREEIPVVKAIRDQAVLAMMIGTGLRRSEVAGLTWGKIQQRDGCT